MSGIQCWLEGSLRRVYPKTPAGTRKLVTMPAARNDRLSFQVCLRNPSLEQEAKAELVAESPDDVQVQLRRVGYVSQLHLNTGTPPDEIEGVEHIPGCVPDPLYPESAVSLGPGESHSFWVTVTVPPDINPGPRKVRLRVETGKNERRNLTTAIDVQPFEEGEFLAIMHPYTSYDVVNDPAAAGLADIFKYTNVKDTPLVKYEDRGVVTHVAGCKVIESTNVKVTAGTPNTYRSYVFGLNAVGAVDLEGRGPSDITDPAKQRFKINIVKGEPSIADPEGIIGAAVSYNFVFTALVLEGPAGIGGSYRYKTLDPESSIA